MVMRRIVRRIMVNVFVSLVLDYPSMYETYRPRY